MQSPKDNLSNQNIYKEEQKKYPPKILSDCILFFRNTQDRKPSSESLFAILEKIKNGTYHNTTVAMRNILAKEGKTKYSEARKNNVPCFMVGLRKIGTDKGMYNVEDATPFLALDIDYKNDDQKENKKILKQLPFVISVFNSIGGSGLCAIVKIDPLKRLESIKAVTYTLKKFGITAADGQENINRLRYVSHDPDIFINQNGLNTETVSLENKGFDPVFKKMVQIKSEGRDVWFEGERHTLLIKVLTWALKAGIPEDMCLELCEKYVRPMLENASNYDIAADVKSVYKSYQFEFNSKPWNNGSEQTEKKYFKFWSINEKGKIVIHRTGLLELLSKNGFANYYADESKKVVMLIRIVNNIVEEITPAIISQFISDHILSLPTDLGELSKYALREAFVRGIDTYLGKNLLNLLPVIKKNFLRDKKNAAYFAFKNGVVEVLNTGATTLIPYDKLSKNIWKNQIIDFEIKINDSYDIFENGEYAKFCLLIAGQEKHRFLYLMKILGYLLHRYKDPSRPYAIILAEEAEAEETGGGTGKGLFMKGVFHLRRGLIIDGRNDSPDKSFRLQRVNLDIEIICIEDCQKKFDFGNLYSWITEGITVEKKNQQEIFIPFSESPKIALTTNYTISNFANHAKRRQRVLEFSNYFSPTNTPEDYFGHLLFSDWPEEEWQHFFNFGFVSTALYLNEGLEEIDNSLSIKRKQLKQFFTEEFLEWWDNYCVNTRGEWNLSSQLYDTFISDSFFDKKNYSHKRFKKAIESACKFFDLKFETRKNRQLGNRAEYRCINMTETVSVSEVADVK